MIKSWIAEQYTKNRDCLGKIRTVGMFNNISSTSCLLVDTSSFDRLFMGKLYRKNKWHKIYLCITLKKIEIMVIIIYIIIIMIIIITILIIKLEDAYLLYLIFWVKLSEYCIWFKIHIFLSFNKVTTSLFEEVSLFQAKKIFFTATLII